MKRISIITFCIMLSISCSKQSEQIDSTKLFNLIKNNRINDIKELIKKGVPVNYKDEVGHTLLMYACIYDKFEIAKYLVEKGANIEDSDNEQFRPIHFNHSPMFINLFLSKGVNLNSQTDEGDTILHMLVIKKIKDEKEYIDRINFLKFLIEHGADPNIKNKAGEKPFHSAMLHNNPKISKFILPHTKNLSKGAIKTLYQDLKEQKEKIKK